MAKFALNVNGKSHAVDVSPDMPLLWVLRDFIGLRGAKYGCGVGSCGACTVLVDNEATKSCQLQVSEVGKAKVVTIEGLSRDGSHPLQKAWIAQDVAQCGYCQCGQIMTAAGLLAAKRKPTDADIDEYMSSVLCRCGTYQRIRTAIKEASK